MTQKSTRKPNFIGKSKVECPVCGLSQEQIRVKPHLFNEGDRDIDMRPRTYKWLVKGGSDIHPPLYYMWHCQNCTFTAGYPFFKEPVKDSRVSISQFKRAIKDDYAQNSAVRGVIDCLRKDINFKNIGYLDAIRLHYIAIYQLLQIDEIASNDSLNLARYCLRLAWLYRDIHDRKELLEQIKVKLQPLIDELREKWPDIPDSDIAASQQAVTYYQNALVGSHMIKTAHDEILLLLLLTRIFIQQDVVMEARKYMTLCKEKTRKLEERLNALDSGSDEASKLAAENRKTMSMVDDVQNIFEDFYSDYKDNETMRAKEFLGELGDEVSGEEKREHLAAKGIDDIVIQTLLPLKKKKKGLFGFLRR